MRKYFKSITSMLALVLCLTAVAFGQETTGNIEGTVKDSTGAVVPNVSITVTSQATDQTATTTTGVSTGFKRTATADSDGFFRILQVPSGVYTVNTEATSGFGGATYENVTVVLGKTTQLDIALAAGTQNVTVDVNVSDAPPVDTTDTKVQTNITAQKIELLPKGVNFTSVLKTVPGTRGEGLAGGFSVDGASGSENVFIIDGQEVTNFRTGTLNGNNNIPTQFVQEVSVKSSGFEAEFGGATGGVINVVTKGGGNDFRGEFGTQFETSKLNGGNRPGLLFFPNNNNTVEYFTAPKTDATDFFPTANLSGPIVKDRMWFFGSYSPQILTRESDTVFLTNAPAAIRTESLTQERQTFRLQQKNEYAFGRVDALPFNNLRLTSTYTWNPISQRGAQPFGNVSIGGAVPQSNFGGTIGILRGSQLTDRQGGRQNSNNVTGQVVWTPTNSLVVSGRFSRGFLNEKLGNYFVPQGTRYRCIENFGNVSGGCTQGQADPSNSDVVRDVSIRTNYEADATYLLTGFGGKHEFKGGYQRFKILNDVERGYANTGIIDLYYGRSISDYLGAPVTPTPGAIGSGELIRFGTVGKGQNTNQSVYIQDKWQPINSLTFTVGVRAEKEDLPSFNGLAPPINFGYGDKIAPRFGVAWDVTGDGKTRLFASYGKFYDRLKFELPRGSFGGDFYRLDFFEVFAGQDIRSFTLQNIIGSFDDRSGGSCPTTGFIASGARSRCQFDYRIASNSAEATLFTGQVDPDLKSFSQREFTVGLERQLSRDYVVRTRYTHKEVLNAIEDAGIINAEGSEAYIIGNPGSGLHLEQLKALGYSKSATPERKYDGLEFSLEKRLSNNYYFNANYTYSRLFGNYSGLASSDEAGRTSPGVNRFFDLPFIGFTAAGEPDNGRLATDRPHVFNAYGAYIFDWFSSKTNSTELSFFTTAQSGTPQTTIIPFITSTIFTRRGDLGRTEMLTSTDLALTHRYRFGRDNRFQMAFDVNVLNAFNEENVTALFSSVTRATYNPATFGFSNPDGSINYVGGINAYTNGQLLSQIEARNNLVTNKDPRYGQPSGFQGPRSVRFGFRLLF